MRNWIVAAAALVSVGAVIVLVADDSRGTADERLAERVCATVLPRARENVDLYESVKQTRALPGREGWRKVAVYTLGAKEIAWKFRKDIRALSRSDTDVGRHPAMTYIVQNAGDGYQTMSREERRVRRLPRSLSLVQSTLALDHLEFALAQEYFDIVGVPFTALHLMPRLVEPFHSTKTCKDLEAFMEEAAKH